MTRHPSAHLLTALLLVLLPQAAHAAPDRFTTALEQGPVYATLAALIGGFLTSLTPCVYPMIAITVSVFGARQTKTRREAMLLSTMFVLGIAAMFTPMGLVAGLTGDLFGSALSNRWVILGIAAVFIALALSMFGLFEFVLPSKLTNKLATMGGVGYGGAFVLGLVSGVVAAPCTGPVLTGILLWIGQTQNPVLGAGALFSFSLGLGVPFWLVGTFAVQLPKSGKWMVSIKSFFGIVMVVVALYLVKNAFPQLVRTLPSASFVPLVALAILALGLLLGAIHLDFRETKSRTIRKVLGIVLSVLGAVVALTWLEMPKEQQAQLSEGGTSIAWLDDEKQALETSKTEQKPLLIDFTADWCSACKRLARETFTENEIRTQLARFVLLKLDASDDDDPRVVDVQKRYRVVGLPTVILIDSKGNEVRRFTDFVPSKELLPVLKEIE